MVDEFKSAGVVVDRFVMTTLLDARVEVLASRLGVGIPTARQYFDDDAVRKLARSMISAVLTAEQRLPQ